MTYRLARPARENDTVFWLSTPEGDVVELARRASEAESKTLRAALTRGRLSAAYAAALAEQTAAEAALAAAVALVDPSIESTLRLENVLKVDQEYVVVRFVMRDCVEVGRAQFGSARAAHAGSAEVALARLRVEALVDVELIIEGAPISAGEKGDITMAFDGRITEVKLVGDADGDVVVDVLKAHVPITPATVFASITGSSKPTLAALTTDGYYEDAALSGWTTAFVRSDVLRVVVDSASGLDRVTVALTCTTAV